MKPKILIFILIILIAFAVFSATKPPAPFAPAADFPRDGALVYIQIEDLPALIKLWNESNFKEQYTSSENFKDFQNHHLGRKLASRWQEFSDAAGFPLDLETVANFSENQAALAVYDIGKLEFVFIAPVSEEVFTATKFAAGKDKFEEQTLGDTTIYRAKVAADRGRQNQELIFGYANGRFVLATSEKLMAQTLHNIGGTETKNKLIDAPLFSALKDKIEPHLATVWVNQVALNEDYYFKRYWLMAKGEKLKNIRAGIFDLEIGGDKIIEHRQFLLNQPAETHSPEKSETAALLNFLPANVPFYRLQATTGETADSALQNTIFEPQKSSGDNQNKFSNRISFDDDYYGSGDYGYLSGKFDDMIDDADDDATEKPVVSTKPANFSEILRSAQPQSVLTFARLRVLPLPKFLEFNRAAVFYLAAPQNFRREIFENQIAAQFAAQITVGQAKTDLIWETQSAENAESRRTLSLPMLGISAGYILRKNILIVANDAAFLDEVSAARAANPETFDDNFNSLTVINLNERTAAYDEVAEMLAGKKAANEFFTQNVKSFVDSIAEIKRIEIKERQNENFLEETVTGFR